MNRLPGLTTENFATLDADLADLEIRIAAVGNLIGPAYGAPWCDKALKILRKVEILRMQVGDRFHEQTRATP